MRRSFITTLAHLLRRIAAELHVSDRYRPELYYMRGPGPKSRARTGLTPDGKATAATRGNGVMR